MYKCVLFRVVCLWMNSNSSLLWVNEQRDGPLCSFCQSLTLIKYPINESHSTPRCSLTQAEKGSGGNPWKEEKLYWCKEEGTDTATVLWVRMCLPLPSKQSADSILGAHYSSLRAGGDATAVGDQGASSVSSAPAALTVFQWETPGHRPAG